MGRGQQKMEKQIYAYIDEFGAHGFKFEDENCSTHFIIAAIIVEPQNVQTVKNGVIEIRKKYFHNASEVKSKNIAYDHGRRCKVLQAMLNLPFSIFSLVYDKRKIYEQSGLRFKQSFYKYINQQAYREITRCFPKVEIIADEMGTSDFRKSFGEYMTARIQHIDLFDEFSFNYRNSQLEDIIQIADIIAGSLAFCYDVHKKGHNEGAIDYKGILDKKILRILELPYNYDTFKVEDSFEKKAYTETDIKIADICYRQAIAFLNDDSKKYDEYNKQQKLVLEYMLFRFMNNHERGYITSNELINNLSKSGYEKLSSQSFQNNIIAKLRDSGVIIGSSSKGYKIPFRKSEVEDYMNHCETIIFPMLNRLKNCNEKIKMASNNEIDFFGKNEFKQIADIIDCYDKNKNI